MIVVRMYGGLGNQLFQYAFGRYLSLKNSTELILDLNWFKYTPKFDTKRYYELNNFCVSCRYLSIIEKTIFRLSNNKYIGKYVNLPYNLAYKKERQYSFDSNNLDIKNNSYIDGYWQSYKYFNQIDSVIRREIRLLSSVMIDSRYADFILNSNSISVHVRRGDYVNNTVVSNVHGVCAIDYYYNAMSYFQNTLSQPNFFIFSDDMLWCKKAFKNFDNVYFMSSNCVKNASVDLVLMSMCKHHIIANSTYSWWGAWLGGGLTIAPYKWFSNATSVDDLLPENWIRM